MRTPEANQASEELRNNVTLLRNLVNDLWWFIENVSDDTANRTELFFKLRERVRAT